ncbi:MAG: response regulator [Lachnospiraceae bacterium]|nr:response regulator [Lachnospiraceae bacterium]
MYQFVLVIQCLSIVVAAAECAVVFKNWKGIQHSYLFLACASTFVSNLGYFFQLRARSADTYMTAVKLSYAGRVWLTFALFLFITELVRIKIPAILKIAMSLFNVASYIVVLTTMKTGLYYRVTGFQVREQFPFLMHDNGIWHHIWSATLILYIVYGVTALFSALRKEKHPTVRKRLLMVMLAILTMSFFLVMNMLKPLPINYVYDITMVSFPIAAVFMFIAIFRYNLLDTATLAREYVIDRLSEGIIAVDSSGQISYSNEPALGIFPSLADEPAKVVDMVRDSIECGEPIRINDRIYAPEANRLGGQGENAGTIYTLTDDTDHYVYMKNLEEQKKMADEANRAKSFFLANMSHEIRTPINAVLGMDEMIIRESSEKNIRSYAKDIKVAGRTLLSLINDILDFSKIEEGRMEILPTQYDISSVINDLVNMIRFRAEKKGLKLEVSVDRDVPRVLYGDEIRIKQVALNLLTNAVKYTNEGKVSLSIGFSKEDDENIILSFVIGDTGIGMKEEDMDRLFSPFSRIEEKRNRSIEGTGLGMSIVRQLLELMGGKLDVKSVYGEGSTFSFGIRQKVMKWEPLGDMSFKSSAEDDDAESYRELFHAADAHILVVDDTEVNLTVIQNLLKKTLIDVDTAGSGMEALAMAKEKHYDIIFIDHMMPEMDGVETLHRIREETDSDSTVCIALTANAVSGAREKYLAAGFSDYISKPVDGRRLEEMIRRNLPEEKIAAVSDEGTSLPAGREGRILVVDDDEVILAATAEILGKDYDVICCQDGKEAVRMAAKTQPDLILLDINLVGTTGFDVLTELKADNVLKSVPVMFITADDDREKEVLGLKNGAADFVRKPFIPEVLRQRSRTIIALDRYQRDLKGEVRKQTRRAERLTKEMMMALSHTVDAKDHYTNGHSERVAAYAAEIGRRMGKTPAEQRQLYEIGLLHDIGKIGIPEEIINKTEKLSDKEFARIKEHTVIGCEILKGIVDMPELSSGARSHHERYDGRGYPDGLARDAIPEVARIICVADCYDAMTSTRTYSKPKPQDVVRAEIERCSGSQFDPDIAAIMLGMIDDDSDYMMNERTGGSSVWKAYDVIWNPAGGEDVTDEEGDAAPSDLPGWLLSVPGIDSAVGIANCGSEESFMSVLGVFHKTAKAKADEIRKLYEDGDIENYTIKVHALKSSARIIGAARLSDLAKELEAAGKDGRWDLIKDKTEGLLDDYLSLDRHLDKLDDDGAEKEPLPAFMRDEAFSTIREIAGSMDYGMMEDVLAQLGRYALSDEDEKTVSRISAQLMQLDWDGIKDTLKQ